MAVYLVSGGVGAGKSLTLTAIMMRAAKEGRRVATNFDLWPERYFNMNRDHTQIDITRLPDFPDAASLNALGSGVKNPAHKNKESMYGVLVIDECTGMYNTRDWNNKSKAGDIRDTISWLQNSRKRSWDVYMIVHHPEIMDKQIRDGFGRNEIRMTRLDGFAIPPKILGIFFIISIAFLVWLRSISVTLAVVFGLVLLFKYRAQLLPKIHIATYFYSGVEVKTERFKGKDYYNVYNTNQELKPQYELNPDGSPAYPDAVGMHSLLSPWHLKGRYHVKPTFLQRLKAPLDPLYFFLTGLIVGAFMLFSVDQLIPDAQAAPAAPSKPAAPAAPAAPVDDAERIAKIDAIKQDIDALKIIGFINYGNGYIKYYFNDDLEPMRLAYTQLNPCKLKIYSRDDPEVSQVKRCD